MSVRRLQDIEKIIGKEGAEIKQFFYPNNTLNGIRFSLAHFTLGKGKSTFAHKMKSGEIYYFLKGLGAIFVDGQKILVKKDDGVYVPPMAKQYLKNIGEEDLNFLCIVDPAWSQNDEVLLE